MVLNQLLVYSSWIFNQFHPLIEFLFQAFHIIVHTALQFNSKNEDLFFLSIPYAYVFRSLINYLTFLSIWKQNGYIDGATCWEKSSKLSCRNILFTDQCLEMGQMSLFVHLHYNLSNYLWNASTWNYQPAHRNSVARKPLNILNDNIAYAIWHRTFLICIHFL